MPNVFHVANLRDSDRRTVRTGEAIGANQGKVIHAVSDTSSTFVGVGGRKAMLISNANQLVSGKVFIAWKVSAQSDVVFASTVNADTGMDLGDRTVTIASGELITACGRGSIGMYDLSWLDASLDPERGGTAPVVDQELGVKGGLWCATGAVSALVPAGAPVAKVYQVFGTEVLIELI